MLPAHRAFSISHLFHSNCISWPVSVQQNRALESKSLFRFVACACGPFWQLFSSNFGLGGIFRFLSKKLFFESTFWCHSTRALTKRVTNVKLIELAFAAAIRVLDFATVDVLHCIRSLTEWLKYEVFWWVAGYLWEKGQQSVVGQISIFEECSFWQQALQCRLRGSSYEMRLMDGFFWTYWEVSCWLVFSLAFSCPVWNRPPFFFVFFSFTTSFSSS